MRKRNRQRTTTKLLSLLMCYLVHHRTVSPTLAVRAFQASVLPRLRRGTPKNNNNTWQTWSLPGTRPQRRHGVGPFFGGVSVAVASCNSYSWMNSKAAWSSSTSSLGATSKATSSQDAAPAAAAPPSQTQYTIDDSVCLPTPPETLQKAVHKACRSLDVYLEKKPMAAHTRRAFDVLVEMIQEDLERHEPLTTPSKLYKGIVLDSGCGTGRSTKLLASSLHPQHLVIGVDRSLARLTKTKENRQSLGDDDNNNNNSDNDDDDNERAAYCRKVANVDNAYLVRAELVDFWRCCVEQGWTRSDPWNASSSDDDSDSDSDSSSIREDGGFLKITHHYLLYPNPYPTKARLSSRWYAHPSFPLLLQLGVETMVLRSNWEGYLSEFAQAVQLANEYYNSPTTSSSHNDDDDSSEMDSNNNVALAYVDSAQKGPTERMDKSVALTNFESKYDSVGEKTFELILHRNPTTTTS